MTAEYQLKRFESGMHYIMLNEETVTYLTANNNKRAVCKINDLVEFHCAILPKKEGWHFVQVSLKICKKLKVKEGDKLTASFKIDTTPYQFEMPEELAEVLATDELANQIFHDLTIGNQRSLIYLVAQVKSMDKRIERALKIAYQIKNGITSSTQILKNS